VHFRHFEDDR
jgi:hypothetical protein